MALFRPALIRSMIRAQKAAAQYLGREVGAFLRPEGLDGVMKTDRDGCSVLLEFVQVDVHSSISFVISPADCPIVAGPSWDRT
jgi:hypothetical protein